MTKQLAAQKGSLVESYTSPSGEFTYEVHHNAGQEKPYSVTKVDEFGDAKYSLTHQTLECALAAARSAADIPTETTLDKQCRIWGV